jgi:glycosyltransferase involved in cell wall biosynthesis
MKHFKPPIPVLYLHHTGKFSGAENSLLHLAKYINRELFKPIFVCPAAGEFPVRLKANKIEVVSHRFGRIRDFIQLLKSVLTICQIQKQHKIRLLHSNGPQTNIPAAIAGKMLRIPVIWHARNLVKPGMIDLDRILKFLPDRIICNSNAIRERFAGKHHFDRAVTIINAVNLNEYTPNQYRDRTRNELGIPHHAIVLGMTSRLASDKGHEAFIKCIGHLSKAVPEVLGLIVGDHIFKEDAWVPEYLKDLTVELGIANRIIFTGFRRDIVKMYDAMDIFVLGTDAEPCGRVLFEAMAMEKAVIATDSGGTPEIVLNDKTGYLYPYGNDRELTKKVLDLIKNDRLIRYFGYAGRKRVEENYTIENYVIRTQEEYGNLIEFKYANWS